EDVFLQKSQYKSMKQLYREAHPMMFLIPYRLPPGHGYTGAKVLDPLLRIMDYVICLDFKSLYPSIIIAFNVCYTTYVSSVFVNQSNIHMFNKIDADGNVHYFLK